MSLAGRASTDVLSLRLARMPKLQPGPNRHHFRVWIKMAIQSGLIESPKLHPMWDTWIDSLER
jgi:hypothetical protein